MSEPGVTRCGDPTKAPERPASIDPWPTEALHAQKMEAVGQLAGGIAHDLSNLMTAMFGWLEIASAQLPSDHGAREALKMVDQAARQAVGLTRSLMTFSHRTPAEKEPIQLNEVLREALRLLGRLLPASIEQRSIIPQEPIWTEGDPTQVQQVVMNLALNARDAMKAGGAIEIELSALTGEALPPEHQSKATGKGVAVLHVRDTGGGIPESNRDRIFEPFFTTKERDRGTGLGLAIVHAIVTEHGGWIEVDSEVGCGSIFRVHLPRVPAPAPKRGTRALPRRDAAGHAGILVVEDNPLVRAMLTTVFVDAGYRLFEAEDGEKGQTLFEENADNIDVAVVDVDLPKVNGLDVLASLRRRKPDVRCIAITGYPLPETTARHLRGLDCGVLKKPFHVPDLKHMVAAALASRRGE